jgi:early secretory antigenic target protein ESAT-6
MFMDGAMKYTFGEITALGQQITQQSNTIEQHLTDLQSDINRLVQEWEGTANQDFMALKTKWEQAAQDLRQVMASIGTAVHQTSEDAQATENSNASRWA